MGIVLLLLLLLLPVSSFSLIVASVPGLQKSGCQSLELISGVDSSAESERKNRLFALIIGIEQYNSPLIEPPLYALNDAREFRNTLTEVLGIPEENIVPGRKDTLSWTLVTMKYYLQKLLPSLLPKDGSGELIIYFSGHGYPSGKDAYLLSSDAQPGFINDLTAYSLNSLMQDISSLPVTGTTLIVDACFSGKAGNGKNIIRNSKSIEAEVVYPYNLKKGINLMLSSGSDQHSFWLDDKKHSAFTFFLLQALKGKGDLNGDGRVSLAEIGSWVNDRKVGLPAVTRSKFGALQQAEIIGNRDFYLPFDRRSHGFAQEQTLFHSFLPVKITADSLYTLYHLGAEVEDPRWTAVINPGSLPIDYTMLESFLLGGKFTLDDSIQLAVTQLHQKYPLQIGTVAEVSDALSVFSAKYKPTSINPIHEELAIDFGREELYINPIVSGGYVFLKVPASALYIKEVYTPFRSDNFIRHGIFDNDGGNCILIVATDYSRIIWASPQFSINPTIIGFMRVFRRIYHD